jgi:hypothetical protein
MGVFHFGPQEGFLSVFESLFLGKRIIFFDTVTCDSIMKEKELGRVIPSDLPSYERTILEEYHKQNSCNIFNAKERTWVKKNLTWEKYCSSMLRIFREACI